MSLPQKVEMFVLPDLPDINSVNIHIIMMMTEILLMPTVVPFYLKCPKIFSLCSEPPTNSLAMSFFERIGVYM